MKALSLAEPGRFVLVDLPDTAAPGPGEALVAIRRIGVCGTDLHAFHGRQPFFTYPRILGHELAVEVLATGPGADTVEVGDRAALRPALDCGACDTCRRGITNACPRLAVLGAHVDGGMRERLVVPARNLHRSQRLDLDGLAMVEPLSIGGHAVGRGAPVPGERALVIGAGPIGLAVTAFLVSAGVAPVVLDLSADRRAFAERWAGVRAVAPGEDVATTVREALGGEPPTLAFDATGSSSSMHRAFDLVAHGGRLVFVGLFQGDVTFHDPDFHRRELTLLASRNATGHDFERSIALLEGGGPDARAWITDRASLDDVPSVFPDWARPGSSVVKAVIEV
ncbi:MAG: zinc-binding alcohol dehydrogenase family protein [Chloroflexota bacterium]